MRFLRGGRYVDSPVFNAQQWVWRREEDHSFAALLVRERRRLWPVRLIRCALWTMGSRMASA